MKQTIPVVDLEQFRAGDADDQRRFVAALGEAIVEYGFVAVDRHGVDREAVRAAYEAVQRLFALPAEVKRRYEDPAGGRERGYAGMGAEHAKHRSVADVKEFWHVGAEVDDPRLPRNVWPGELPGFREAALALFDELHGCGRTLLRALARFLDAEEDAFLSMIRGGNTVLRLIRYPGPDEVEPTEDAVWAAEHEDINLITLLVEATEPGLQLMQRDGRWLDVAPIPGQLIADTGDMMQRLTNGVLPATTHRVLAPPDAKGPRYSMPFFVHPHPDFVLSPLPGCVTEDNPRRWSDITADGYLRERLREIGVLKDDETAPPEASQKIA